MPCSLFLLDCNDLAANLDTLGIVTSSAINHHDFKSFPCYSSLWAVYFYTYENFLHSIPAVHRIFAISATATYTFLHSGIECATIPSAVVNPEKQSRVQRCGGLECGGYLPL
jgi:hypothetical protein